MTTERDPRVAAVINLLAVAGVVCHWDYPGYFAAYVEGGGRYVYAEDGEVWYGHFEPLADGSEVVSAPDLREVRLDATAEEIAGAILDAVRGPAPERRS